MSELKVKKLRCNYLKNPLGTSLRKPQFSWMLASDAKGALQRAYQIQVSTHSDFSELLCFPRLDEAARDTIMGNHYCNSPDGRTLGS